MLFYLIIFFLDSREPPPLILTSELLALNYKSTKTNKENDPQAVLPKDCLLRKIAETVQKILIGL